MLIKKGNTGFYEAPRGHVDVTAELQSSLDERLHVDLAAQPLPHFLHFAQCSPHFGQVGDLHRWRAYPDRLQNRPPVALLHGPGHFTRT